MKKVLIKSVFPLRIYFFIQAYKFAENLYLINDKIDILKKSSDCKDLMLVLLILFRVFISSIFHCMVNFTSIFISAKSPPVRASSKFISCNSLLLFILISLSFSLVLYKKIIGFVWLILQNDMQRTESNKIKLVRGYVEAYNIFKLHM